MRAVDKPERAPRHEFAVGATDRLRGTVETDISDRRALGLTGRQEARHKPVHRRARIDFPDNIIAGQNAPHEVVNFLNPSCQS